MHQQGAYSFGGLGQYAWGYGVYAVGQLWILLGGVDGGVGGGVHNHAGAPVRAAVPSLPGRF
jgi:hypothetical protein